MRLQSHEAAQRSADGGRAPRDDKGPRPGFGGRVADTGSHRAAWRAGGGGGAALHATQARAVKRRRWHCRQPTSSATAPQAPDNATVRTGEVERELRKTMSEETRRSELEKQRLIAEAEAWTRRGVECGGGGGDDAAQSRLMG